MLQAVYKRENKDSYPLNFKRPCMNTVRHVQQYSSMFSHIEGY